MRCLWLTLADPDPPENGQFIYSGGLIRGAAAAGLDLTVLGLCRTEGHPWRGRKENVTWHITGDPQHSKMEKLISPVPVIALRTRVPTVVRAATAYLEQGRWDAVVFDSICAGWMLPEVIRFRRRLPSSRIVFLAHNDETALARREASSRRGLHRFGRALDVIKVRRLERRLLRAADLATANSPDDCDALAALGGRPVHFLPPGYGGAMIATRAIDSSVPRRAIVVGSFDWAVKRTSLEAFLAIAVPLFGAAGVELQIVGGAPASYLDGLRRRYPGVEFTGRVPDVVPYMAAARIALVPDQAGGFKLKSLDYVFNRLPIFAMAGAVPGTPLVDGTGIRVFETHGALARGVVNAIDDLAGLNAQQDAAFAACLPCFEWKGVGRRLVGMIECARRHSSPPLPTREDPAAQTGSTAPLVL